MITCLELSTRAIGNALFEYATLFGVGKKLNLPIRIPYSEKSVHEPTGQNIIPLTDIFNITAPFLSEEEKNSITNSYTESSKDFDPNIFNIQDNTNLIGFYQAERYFKHCKEELLKELTFGNAWTYQAIKKFSDLGINPKNCISIHIRRGDYTKPHLQPFHPVLEPNYYMGAINYITEYYKEYGTKDIVPRKILIFSDDIEFCKSQFEKDNIFIIVDNSEFKEYNATMDLCMMHMIKGAHVIANSSFSWWGAYLSQCPLVCYPSQWFGYGYNNFNIVDVKEWIKI